MDKETSQEHHCQLIVFSMSPVLIPAFLTDFSPVNVSLSGQFSFPESFVNVSKP